MHIPRFVIAGEHSGVGKTTLTLGMLVALKDRGLVPQPFKVGPDFLDPIQHTAAIGRPSRNLDTWMFADAVRPSFIRGSRDSSISVIEGVMGLYDGLDGRSEEGSTAHLAKLLKAPVIVIIDASASSRTVGAVALGMKLYDPEVNVAGIIFNNVASKKHLDMLESSLKGTPSLGGVPQEKNIALASRHLGLVPAGECHDEDRYAQMGKLVAEHCDLDRIIEIANDAPDLGPAKFIEPRKKRRARVRIGVARDEAFNFYYEDNFDMLRGYGAEPVMFSPLRDKLPDVDGLYFGGGYPEVFCEELSANKAMLEAVKKGSDAGLPIYAECGGMMYTCASVADLEGHRYRMAGIFDADVEMTDRVQAIGYAEVGCIADNIMCLKGWSTRGHEFHYSKVSRLGDEAMAYSMKLGRGIADGKDGLLVHNTLASYTHLHFASCPDFARRFVDSCIYHRRR